VQIRGPAASIREHPPPSRSVKEVNQRSSRSPGGLAGGQRGRQHAVDHGQLGAQLLDRFSCVERDFSARRRSHHPFGLRLERDANIWIRAPPKANLR
jgi:hypothetical protein